MLIDASGSRNSEGGEYPCTYQLEHETVWKDMAGRLKNITLCVLFMFIYVQLMTLCLTDFLSYHLIVKFHISNVMKLINYVE